MKLEIKKIDEKGLNSSSYIPINKLMEFSKDTNNLIITRTELYNFINNYFLNTKKINKNKCVNKEDLDNCKNIIIEKYNISKKMNVKESLKKINFWCKAIKEFIDSENLKITNLEKINTNTLDTNISVYDLIKKGKKLISFQSAYCEYKQVYLIPDDTPGDIEEFKRFLDLNYYKIDEVSFVNFVTERIEND